MQAKLTIDLAAIVANWRALARTEETAAVVKADAYGLGLAPVAKALAKAGARTFFVAQTEEGVALRNVLGPGAEIFVFGGLMAGDEAAFRDFELVPCLNSIEQAQRFAVAPTGRYALQLDTGMNRLGLEPADLGHLPDLGSPVLTMSHLACADEPDHPQNAAQLSCFQEIAGTGRRSLAATGGTLLGADYHFEMTRPGIGLYGGLPFAAAQPVVTLSLPVIQIREVAAGEAVGYGASYVADRPRRIATLSAGYADGLIRAMSGGATLWAGDTPCPLAGRVSMDLLTVDVTEAGAPEWLDILGPHQGVDALADAAGTIGYEVLTSLGGRYARSYTT
ncbi:alanine racemase [Pontivivens insulae]|uniref:Alanine racemase n=1 Tax=Pontivivens insulae TaxID=1639689 RepID=A0A2R8AAL4_9RHOB|nr:alanine racemase [Pontivivens insulae]RED13053.1 alanine racemase [Pontivivens insulae]SPF29145.1 Alanine racemase, biosynthetic [Pontivivens insulae]